MKNSLTIISWCLLALLLTVESVSAQGEQECFTGYIAAGDRAMSTKNFGNALQQYFTAFNCNYIQGNTVLRNKALSAIDSLEMARRKSKDAEILAKKNEKEAIRLKEEAVSEKKAKEQALDTATYYARRSEGLLMTALSQNILEKNGDKHDALFLAYGGYKLADEASKVSAFRAFLDAAYSSSQGSLYSSEERFDRYDQVPFSKDIMVSSNTKLFRLIQDSLSILIDTKSPLDPKLTSSGFQHQFVTWGYDRGYTLWNNFQPKRFTTHTAPILSLEYSHDGQYVISGGRDHLIMITSIQTGNAKQIQAHAGNVYDIILNPSSSSFLSRSSDGTIKYWKADGSLQTSLEGKYFQHAVFSGDGKYIAASDADTKVMIWDTTGARIDSFYGEGLTVAEEIIFLPNEVALLIRSGNTIFLARKGLGLVKQCTLMSKVTGMKLQPSGNHIVAWTKQGEVKYIDLLSDEEIYLQNGEIEILSGAFSTNGNYIVTSDRSGNVFLYDDMGNKLQYWQADPNHPIPAQFDSRDNSLLLAQPGNIEIRRVQLPDSLLEDFEKNIQTQKNEMDILSTRYGFKHLIDVSGI